MAKFFTQRHNDGAAVLKVKRIGAARACGRGRWH